MNDTKYWIRDRLWLNAELAEKVLTGFIRDAVETTRSKGVVVGLSGGVDSALAAALAARALGASRVHTYMPVSYTHLTLPTIVRECRSRWSPYH